MNFRSSGAVRVFSILLLAISANAAYFDSDIPGDGTIFCGAPVGVACPSAFNGTVSATGAVLSGILQANASTLDLQIGGSPASLVFGVTAANVLGPLGLNPLFNPVDSRVAAVDRDGDTTTPPTQDAFRDVTVPISGQLLTLNVTNKGSSTLTSLDFVLNEPGLSFGIQCTGLIDVFSNSDAADDTSACSLPANWGLLATPAGPGTLNSSATETSSPEFGNVLRFTNVNLGVDETGTFTFFLTDYKRTRNDSTSGTAASESFSLDMTPGFSDTAVPEPASASTVVIALVALAAARFRSRRRLRD